MATDATRTLEHEQRLDEACTAYLQALEAGPLPNRQEWLSRYTDVAEELAEFIDAQGEFESLAAPLREVADAARLDTPTVGATPHGASVELPAAELGETVGDYELLQEIGRGGMGIVYKARQRSLNRLVALKMIKAGHLANATDIHRFRAEAETVARLDHPNIVPIYEVNEWRPDVIRPSVPYFCMKLIEGGSLSEYVSPFTDQPRAAAHLLETIARAVHHAHQRGVLHRDLKPGNILLSFSRRSRNGAESWTAVESSLIRDERLDECTPFVTDFGLAKRLADTSLVTTDTGQLVGTPSYMSPEQAVGTKAITTATDVYGLGAILYVLLTGRPPFIAASPLDMMVQLRERDPDLPSRVRPGVSRELETIARRAMAKNPEERYGSAQELADDLRRYLEDRPIHAKNPSLLQRARKWARRHRTVVRTSLAAAFVVGMILAGSVGWILRDRATRQMAVNKEVDSAVQEAEQLLYQAKHQEAMEAVKRAEGILANGGTDEFRERVQELRKDLSMAVRVEEIRLPGNVGPQQADLIGTSADASFAEAFRDYGIDVEILEPEHAAELIRARLIRFELAMALDIWAHTRAKLPDGVQRAGATSWKRLVAVARASDPDEWRNRIRDALEQRNTTALAEIAVSPKIGNLPVQTLSLLGEALNPELSVTVLRQAQQKYPGDFMINFQLAWALDHMQPQNRDGAIRFYTAASALRPRNVTTLLVLAYALNSQDKSDEAIAVLRQGVELNPESADLRYNLGVALGGKKSTDEAIAEYREAIRLKPAFAEAHQNLGASLATKGLVDEAISELRDAIRLKPAYADAHYNLGLIMEGKGAVDEAIFAYKEALRLRPDSVQGHVQLGNAYATKGRLEEAMAEYNEAIRLKPDFALAHYNLGIVLVKSGLHDQAISAYTQAIRLQPHYAEAHVNLGNQLRNKGLTAEAVAAFEEAFRLKPGLPEASGALAWCLVCQPDLQAHDVAKALQFSAALRQSGAAELRLLENPGRRRIPRRRLESRRCRSGESDRAPRERHQQYLVLPGHGSLATRPKGRRPHVV